MKTKHTTIKNLVSIILCLALVLCAFASCGESKTVTDVTLTGKENVLEIENNFAKEAADYLEQIWKTASKKELQQLILSELKAAGYKEEQIELQSFRGYGIFKGNNIVVTVPGAQTDKQIIVGGHYDGNGAGDNGSGMALLLAQAVGLCGKTPACTVKYVFFDHEELGMLGAKHYAKFMSDDEINATLFMVNIDSIGFGDYACIYGGKQDDDLQQVTQTEAYELAMNYASSLGFNVYDTKALDGYFAANGTGPALDPMGVFTNPWTFENPAPANMSAASPTTLPASDHVPFIRAGIPYIYFEATNWFAEGNMNRNAYTGYYETYDKSIGTNGMFMNTKHDTLENLERYFPGRAMEHFNVYSPILSKLIMEPQGE